MLAKAKAVILEKTGDAEYRDNRSRGSLSSAPTKSEHSIELVQLTSHVASAMHAEKGEQKKESEPLHKTARRDDIVMMIDGETFCVPEEDVPKEYQEEDDQVLLTEQVHEGTQRELQLIKDSEVSKITLRADVP